MTVYIDEVFLVNLIMDWLILWSVGYMGQARASRARLAAGAALGACYSVAIFSPWGALLAALPVKLGCSLLMLRATFPFTGWRNFLKQTAYFYLISFVLGGAALAVPYLLERRAVRVWNGIALTQVDFRLFWLALAAGLAGLAVFLLRQHLRRDLSAPPLILTARVVSGGRQASLRLLVDTGNSLTDPLSGWPVIVAEQEALLELWPEPLQTLLREARSADQIFLAAAETELAGRLRLIPYRTVGRQGYLLGFRPDAVILYGRGGGQSCGNVLVAMSEQKFSAYGTYQGLLPPELL